MPIYLGYFGDIQATKPNNHSEMQGSGSTVSASENAFGAAVKLIRPINPVHVIGAQTVKKFSPLGQDCDDFIYRITMAKISKYLRDHYTEHALGIVQEYGALVGQSLQVPRLISVLLLISHLLYLATCPSRQGLS